jgi:signal transduction histidine kinase
VAAPPTGVDSAPLPKTRDRKDMLLEAGLTLASELSLPIVLQRIVDLAAQITDARYGALGVLGKDGSLVKFLTTGISAEERKAIGPLPTTHGVLGALMHDLRPIRIPNIVDHPASTGFPEHHPRMRSFLGVPVRAMGKVFGNLYLADKRSAEEFSPEDEQALVMLAAQAGVAIANASHDEGLLQQQAGVAELGRLALIGTGPQQLMEHAVQLVATTLKADRVRVLELMPNGKELLLRAGVGWRAGLIGTATVSLANTQVGYLFESNEPLIIEDFGTDQRFSISWLLQEHPVRSGIRAVIRGQSAPFGELAAYTKRRHRFTEEDVVFMREVANVLAEAFIRLKAEQSREESLQHLREVNQSRRRLLQRLSEVAEEERKRIANDIHDDSLQMLAGLGMRLQLLAQKTEDPEIRGSLREVNSALSSAGQRLRKLIFDLRPDTLELGLGAALRFFFDQTATDTDPELTIEDGLPERLPMPIRLIAYRASQEALRNVRKHARAQHVNISLSDADGGVSVLIHDDGAGFDTSHGSPPGHIGLIAIRERIHLAGGKSTVTSEPGKGTTVEFWLPRQPSD